MNAVNSLLMYVLVSGLTVAAPGVAHAGTAIPSASHALPSSATYGSASAAASTVESQKAGTAVCTAALPAVKDNIRAQLGEQSAAAWSISLGAADFVYKAPGRTHCVTQLRLTKGAGSKAPYTLNYDVSPGQVLVYAIYNGAGTAPVNLLTYAAALAKFAALEHGSESNIPQSTDPRLKPYLQILFDPHSTYASHIAVYAQLCAAGLDNLAYVGMPQRGQLVNVIDGDLNRTSIPSSVGSSTNSELQAVFCALNGFFPQATVQYLLVLPAAADSAGFVSWVVDQITGQSEVGHQWLGVFLRWYKQTLQTPGKSNSWTHTKSAMTLHESLATAILGMAGNSNPSYLTMMTHDPDAEVAAAATNQILSAAASKAQAANNLRQSFFARIHAAINSDKQYPRSAILAGETGAPTVSFEYRDGHVSDVKIMHSSGHESLDRAAVKAVQNAKFPPPPSKFVGQTLQLTATITFSLG